MKPVKTDSLMLLSLLLLTLSSCNGSSDDNKPAEAAPASAKEAIISVDKSLQTLAPDCAVKIAEIIKGVELKEYTAQFNCDTSESKVSTTTLKQLELRLSNLLSTLVIAKRSSLDTNQQNYIDAIEKEANLNMLSIRNSFAGSEKNDKAAAAQITAFLKKWDCELQNAPMEKWPFHMLQASATTCKKINLASYASVYELEKDFAADLYKLNSNYLRPDSKPGLLANQMKLDFDSIFQEVKRLHVASINQYLPDYVTGYSYAKSIVIDGVPLETARVNPRMLEKIILVQEFFKLDLKKNKADSEFYKLLNNKIEEIHFLSNQVAPYELGFAVSSTSCTLDKGYQTPGYTCYGNADTDMRVTAKSSYPNKEFATLRVSLKNENIATANLQFAIPEVNRLINENATDKFAKLSSATYYFKYNLKNLADSRVDFRTLNGHLGGNIDSLQLLLDRVSATIKNKQFTNKHAKTVRPISYVVLFNFDWTATELSFPEFSADYGGYHFITIVINILDSEETIAAKLNPFLVPAQ